jgi:hypothetical protein
VLSSPPESQAFLTLVSDRPSGLRTSPIFKHWQIFAAAVFLISVPVFFEAPLVRYFPWLSLALGLSMFAGTFVLRRNPRLNLAGDLLTGFTWTWIAGSIYWGWFRLDPTLHLPIEAIALPVALLGLRYNWCRVGQAFYLGSLFGTVVTDVYFYIAGLIPAWEQLMLKPDNVVPILQTALMQMYHPWGLAWTIILGLVLLFVGSVGLIGRSEVWVAFSGAVLSTILVDGLFWLAAVFA